MIDPTQIQVIRDLVTIFGVIAGFSYYVMTVQSQRKNQKLQGLFTVWNALRDPTFYQQFTEVLLLEWEDYDDFMKKYGARANTMMSAKWGTVFEYLDMLGYIWKNGVVDKSNFADITTAVSVVVMWRRYKPIVERYRKEVYPHMWQWWEQLAEALSPYIRETHLSQEHIDDFILTYP